MRWLLAGILLVAATAARADEEYENKKALAYLKVGRQRQEGGDCKGAVGALRRGIEHKALPELSLRLGQCLRTLGDGPGAQAAFRAWLKAAPAGAPERAEVERWLAEGGKAGAGESPPPAPATAPSKGAKGEPPRAAQDEAEEDPFSAPDRRAPVEKCRRGQVRSKATANHCCWPEQVWVAEGAGGRCFGTPACPRDFRPVTQGGVKGCEFVDPTLPRKDGSCARGRELTDDRCCWPDQEWLDGECTGRPHCPRGFRRQGEECLLDEPTE